MVILEHEKAALNIAGVWGAVIVGISVSGSDFGDPVEVGAFLPAVTHPQAGAQIHLHSISKGTVVTGRQDMDRDSEILRVASRFPFPVAYVYIFEKRCPGNVLVPSEPEVAVRLNAPVPHEYERAVLVGQVQIVHEQVCRLENPPSVRQSLRYPCFVEPDSLLVSREVQMVGSTVEILVHVQVDSPSITEWRCGVQFDLVTAVLVRGVLYRPFGLVRPGFRDRHREKTCRSKLYR